MTPFPIASSHVSRPGGSGSWMTIEDQSMRWVEAEWMTSPGKHRCPGKWDDPDDGRPQRCVRSVYSHFDPNLTRQQSWQYCDECWAAGRVPAIINPMPPIREWVRAE